MNFGKSDLSQTVTKTVKFATFLNICAKNYANMSNVTGISFHAYSTNATQWRIQSAIGVSRTGKNRLVIIGSR